MSRIKLLDAQRFPWWSIFSRSGIKHHRVFLFLENSSTPSKLTEVQNQHPGLNVPLDEVLYIVYIHAYDWQSHFSIRVNTPELKKKPWWLLRDRTMWPQTWALYCLISSNSLQRVCWVRTRSSNPVVSATFTNCFGKPRSCEYNPSLSSPCSSEKPFNYGTLSTLCKYFVRQLVTGRRQMPGAKTF